MSGTVLRVGEGRGFKVGEFVITAAHNALTAIRRASSLVSSLAADRRPGSSFDLTRGPENH